MKKASPRLLLALTLALLAGCAGSSDTGAARFAISVPQALSSDISRVSVTTSSTDFPSISVDLTPTQGVWGGVLGDIPAGADRSFLAQAFNSSGAILFEGAASGVTISSGQTTLVAITLQELNPPPPFQNEAPLIDSLVASSTAVPAGGVLSLLITAHDPNPGDTLAYAWSATAGSFSAASSTATSWTAPAFTGIQTLTFTVTDAGGFASSVSLAVNVVHAGGPGEAQFSISFNSSPRVVALGATPTLFAVGQATAVSVSASDPDGDPLSYTWDATCAGSWSNASSSSAQFTPSELPTGACNNCRLTVIVTDGRGGQTTGTAALCVSNAPPLNHLHPVIVHAYRSSGTATPGQVLTYEVGASDPEGSALTFSWAANAGTLGTPAHGASHSRITWTAPSCVSASIAPTLTATVTNAFGLTAPRSFAVTGLPACPTASWASTGFMATSRSHHVATRLSDGKVLISGGLRSANVLSTAEVYELASGTWSAAGSMASPRWFHTATLLPNGKVLIAGGSNSFGPIATAELYDPATGTWSATSPMASPRDHHTATRLPNGKVLITGGDSGRGSLATAELYDPATGTWSTAGSMSSPRHQPSAALLPNGKVLVSGGYSGGHLTTAELYDPATGTWSATGSMASARSLHTMTPLPHGKVLVSGGHNNSILATAELYDPATGTWSTAGSMGSPRYEHAATLLPNGKVLISGGTPTATFPLATAELYDTASGTWSATLSMASPRRSHMAALLPNGKVLVSGGDGSGGPVSSAEVYTP